MFEFIVSFLSDPIFLNICIILLILSSISVIIRAFKND